MTLNLRLFGDLKQFAPDGERRGRAILADVPAGFSAQQLILWLGIPYGEDEGQIVVVVNDVEVDHSRVLQEGDTVSLFEPLAGG